MCRLFVAANNGLAKLSLLGTGLHRAAFSAIFLCKEYSNSNASFKNIDKPLFYNEIFFSEAGIPAVAYRQQGKNYPPLSCVTGYILPIAMPPHCLPFIDGGECLVYVMRITPLAGYEELHEILRYKRGVL